MGRTRLIRGWVPTISAGRMRYEVTPEHASPVARIAGLAFTGTAGEENEVP